MIICPNCGRENEDEYKYCLGCGTVLPRPQEQVSEPSDGAETVQCPNCGAEVPSSFKFCGECGSAIHGVKTSSPPGSPEPSPAEQEAPEKAEKEAPEPEGETVAQLVVIKPDGTEGAKIPLQEGTVDLGRDSDYDVLASDPFLSPRHASIVASKDGFKLRDEGSLNGVFVRIHGEVELTDGDYVRLGQELLHFKLLDEVEPIVERAKDEKTLSGGAPDSGYWGRLSLVAGPDVETRGFVFSDDEITIGREVGDILFRDDGFVSGKHARLSKVEGKVFLKDLGSSNGTYIRISGERDVSDGDLILMGQQLFRLES